MPLVETGGILLGTWDHSRAEVFISEMIGPGPEAVHERTRFVPDAAYQESELSKRFHADPQRNNYLGDWHTHPFGGAYVSYQDRLTLMSIAAHHEARVPAPVMLILAGIQGWTPKLWRYKSADPQIKWGRPQLRRLRLHVCR